MLNVEFKYLLSLSPSNPYLRNYECSMLNGSLSIQIFSLDLLPLLPPMATSFLLQTELTLVIKYSIPLEAV